MNFVKCNWIAIIVTIVVAAVFATVPMKMERTATNWPPSLGDWGDFIGGAMAIVAFIWLIVGHYENQKQIASTNRDLEIQTEATREVVSALATIARANQVQVGEVFANAEPIFVPTDTMATDISPISFRVNRSAGYVRVRNDGALAKLVGVISLEPHVTVSLEGNRLCPTGSEFRFVINSTKPLKTAGPITVVLSFDNKLGTRGWAKFSAKSIDELPQVEHGHEQYS